MARWPNALTDLLGIDHPILQAPMAGSTTPGLTAAVSNAGGLGGHGCAMLAPAELEREIEALRGATNRPFNLNFFVHRPPNDDPDRLASMRRRLAPYYAELGIEPPEPLPPPAPPLDDAAFEVVLDARPAVVSFHFGLPEQTKVDALKAAGVIVISSATTVAEARRLEAHGVDAIIAQGYEAGGHRGTFESPFESAQVGTMALVPQVVDAVRCPVIAAGGIMDGRGIAAAFMLGAAGAQLGTAFLGCPEASVPAMHRAALRASSDDGTAVTRAFTGRPARGLVNRFVRETAADQADALDFPLQRGLTAPLAAAAAKQGSAEFTAMWAGQGAPLTRELPAADLVRALVTETERALGG